MIAMISEQPFSNEDGTVNGFRKTCLLNEKRKKIPNENDCSRAVSVASLL